MGLFDPPAPDAVKEKERERELLETQKESKACYFCKIIFFVGALLTFSIFYEKEKIQKERSAEVEKGLTPMQCIRSMLPVPDHLLCLMSVLVFCISRALLVLTRAIF
ncbi:unnamed protein product [Oikopleura dioica]|uniref:Uncharacterized protein n=1 Tax=Oikopleura dioica TaxID=34765 RepID=E4XBU3_OIKDI|nr:unnamed protein product [Oikopleura dioica]